MAFTFSSRERKLKRMNCKTSILISPQIAYNVARQMRGEEIKKLNGNLWYKFLRSEHSPIRIATYRVDLEDIPYWVSVHFTRHKIGIEHFVTSRREDITGKARSPLDLVNHIMICNAQALITMARKRLCKKAASETVSAMLDIRESLRDVDFQLYCAMQPDCIYRNRCNELNPCGWYDSL